MKKLIAAVVLAVTIMPFQSCQPTNFSATDMQKAALSPINTPSGVAVGVSTAPAATDVGTTSTAPAATSEPAPIAQVTITRFVICLVNDPNSSEKFNADGMGEPSINGALCMSENACLNIVSQKFTVTGIFPGSDGVCGNNPNVVRVTDAQVQTLINQAP